MSLSFPFLDKRIDASGQLLSGLVVFLKSLRVGRLPVCNLQEALLEGSGILSPPVSSERLTSLAAAHWSLYGGFSEASFVLECVCLTTSMYFSGIWHVLSSGTGHRPRIFLAVASCDVIIFHLPLQRCLGKRRCVRTTKDPERPTCT